MYTLDEVLPFIYANMDDEPRLKIESFNSKEAFEAFSAEMDELLNDPIEGDYTLTFENFTATNDIDEIRTFSNKTFNLQVTKCDHVLDDSYEGKTWYHYAIHMTDVDTKEKYILSPHYYQPNYDFTALHITKVKPKKPKKEKAEKQTSIETSKSMFVVVERTPEDYNISGIFSSLEKAVKSQAAQNVDKLNHDRYHIEEMPVDTIFTYNMDVDSIISGALNVYNLRGEEFKN